MVDMQCSTFLFPCVIYHVNFMFVIARHFIDHLYSSLILVGYLVVVHYMLCVSRLRM